MSAEMANRVITLPGFPDNTEKFLCDPASQSWRKMFMVAVVVMMVIVVGCFGMPILTPLPPHIAASGIDQYVLQGSLAFLIVILAPLLAFFVGMPAVILGYSDIAVGKDGVWLHLIASWYLLVPRQSFGKMEISEVHYTGMKGHLKPHGCSFAIHVPGLTFFHGLVGLMYGLWGTPVFLVTPDHERYEILLKKLKELRMAYRHSS